MKGLKLFSLVFLGIGIVLLSVSAFQFSGRLRQLAEYEPATGTVTVFEQRREGVRTYNYPVVVFTTRLGEEVTFTGHLGTDFSPFAINDQVAVRYNPGDPRDAFIHSFFSAWFGTMVTAIIGLPCLLVGAFLSLHLRRPRKRPQS